MTSLEFSAQNAPDHPEIPNAENIPAILDSLKLQLEKLKIHLEEFKKHDVPSEIIEGTKTTIAETEELVKKLQTMESKLDS